MTVSNPSNKYGNVAVTWFNKTEAGEHSVKHDAFSAEMLKLFKT